MRAPFLPSTAAEHPPTTKRITNSFQLDACLQPSTRVSRSATDIVRVAQERRLGGEREAFIHNKRSGRRINFASNTSDKHAFVDKRARNVNSL
jgi:hypothetical protein